MKNHNHNILVIGGLSLDLNEWLSEHKNYTFTLLKPENTEIESHEETANQIIDCDFTSQKSFENSLKDIPENTISVVSRNDAYFQQVVWALNYLNLNGPDMSVAQITNKIRMRSAFKKYFPEITPDFAEINNEEDLVKFIDNHNFPIILKPANLMKSALITKNENLNEALNNYRFMIKNIEKTYKKFNIQNNQPQILAEEFLEGSKHSVQVFMKSKDEILSTEVVDLVNGTDIGYDDNFLYSRTLPSSLSETQQKELIATAEKAMIAMELEFITGHVELVYTKNGAKIIEVNPRIGGYRYRMFKKARNVDLFKILIDIGNNNLFRYSPTDNGAICYIELLPRQIGKFSYIKNAENIEKLDSHRSLIIKAKRDELIGPSSKGFSKVAIIRLQNTSFQQLKNDYEYILKNVEVIVD